MKTINLEEIWMNSIQKYDNINGSTVWSIGKDSMLEFGKQLLELAAENAKIKYVDYGNFQPGSCYESEEIPIINKQSILDTINQVV